MSLRNEEIRVPQLAGAPSRNYVVEKGEHTPLA
jgi:hypothetical protein